LSAVARAVVAEPAATARSSRRPSKETMWPLGAYALLSLLLFGLPVIGHFGSHIIASDPIDSSQFMWFFAWWPHAILHGLNPFITHAMFVPSGFNLTWSTAMPGPSILLSPITLAFGPAVTWNVIQLASPALSGWAMFLLCRHVTGRRWPSLAGGYLYGFSPYMLVHLTGGPYLTLVMLPPVIVLLVLKRIDGTIGSRAFTVWMTIALTAQYSISSEVLATATFFGAVAMLVAFILFPERRRALLDVVRLLIFAFIGTAILISPFLYYFVFGHHYPPGAVGFSADLGSFATPPTHLLLSRQKPIAGSSTESYLGLPLIALLCAFTWQHRHSRRTRLLAISLVITGVASLGEHLFFRGHKTSIPGPWIVFGHLPVLHYALPIRFALLTIFAASVMFALWLCEPISRNRRGVLRTGLAALAVLAIFPDVGSAAWNTPIKDPVFFSSGEYRHYLTRSDNVLTVPVWGPNERWQADTGFYFKLSDGYAGNPFPAAYTRYPIWNALLIGALIPNYAADLRSFVRAKRVTAIVVDNGYTGHWRQLFGSLGVRPIATGGVLFYRLR
jgi:hypothetical protein